MEWICKYCGSANIGFKNCECCGAPTGLQPRIAHPHDYMNRMVMPTGMILNVTTSGMPIDLYQEQYMMYNRELR